MARKTETSYEVKKRWMDNNYKRYSISLRYDIDSELIAFIEENKANGIYEGTTDIIRQALNEFINSGK